MVCALGDQRLFLLEGERARKRSRVEEKEEDLRPAQKMRRILHEDVLVPKFLGSPLQKEELEVFSEFAKRVSVHPVLENVIREDGLSRLVRERLLVPDSITFEKAKHAFNTMVEEIPSAPDQKSSGRCWMFAALNLVRTSMMKKYVLSEDFEFSESYLFFWDKLERANLCLERVIQNAHSPLDSEWNESVFHHPVEDGGDWQYFQNLVEKYGLVPKKDMPETADTSASGQLVKILSTYLRVFGLELRKMSADQEVTQEDLLARKKEQLQVVYEILVRSFREPPKVLTWEFSLKGAKNSKKKTVPNLTPQDFYHHHVPFQAHSYACLINNVKEGYEFDTMYASEASVKMAGGALQAHLNLEYEEIIDAVILSLKGGDPVYFSCNVRESLDEKQETLDLRNYDFSLLFPKISEMTKKERVDTGDTRSTHAMTLVGVHLEEGRPVRWCVLNSWGNKRGKDGKITMTHEWFLQNTFKFVVPKKYLSKRVVNLYKQKPQIISIDGMHRLNPDEEGS